LPTSALTQLCIRVYRTACKEYWREKRFLKIVEKISAVNILLQKKLFFCTKSEHVTSNKQDIHSWLGINLDMQKMSFTSFLEEMSYAC